MYTYILYMYKCIHVGKKKSDVYNHASSKVAVLQSCPY